MSMAGRSRGGRKSLKKGVGLTLMVCGKAGTGRTTFINTLCETAVIPHRIHDEPERAHIEQPIRIKPYQVDLEEEGVRISLTVVDTPGLGDAIDNDDNFREVLNYLERQFDEILAMESRIKRNPRFKDDRVHALLYFIEPTGHALREIDILLMRALCNRVNVIPVIGRADSFTPSELRDFKQRVMEDIEYHALPIYNFPYDVEEDDEEIIAENAELRASLPFAIVGSEEEIEISGELVRVRRYPWGVVEVDNPAHTDFGKLRSALFSTHLTEFKEITHDFLYENYRTEKLSKSSAAETESILAPEEIANQASRLTEERLRREEEKLREVELRVQREIAEKRQELLAREENLRNLESRLATASQSQADL